MLAKTRAIVLHTVRYGEKSLIVTLYTERYGRQTAILNAARGAGSKNKAAWLQPLFLVETDTYVHNNREIQRIKEIRLTDPYLSIPFEVRKSAQLLFLAEVLRRILLEEVPHPALFEFMENALLYFDIMEKGSANFHLWFLVRLTGYLGVFPQTIPEENRWFDMQTGLFVSSEPLHPGFMDRETTSLLRQFMELNIHALPALLITARQRNLLIDKILEYLHFHFGNLQQLKSRPVLKELFND